MLYLKNKDELQTHPRHSGSRVGLPFSKLLIKTL